MMALQNPEVRDSLSAMVPVTPYLIAGGGSVRFGRDKRWLTIGGEPLLYRSLRLLRESTGVEATVVANDLDGRLDAGIRILHDAVPQKGPLGGLVAALRDAKTRWILIAGVDLPMLTTPDLLALIREAEREPEPPVVTLSLNGSIEPLAALYNTGNADFWSERLSLNQLALHDGIRELGWRGIEPRSGRDALLNVNRPEDWEKVVEHSGRDHDGSL